MAGSVAGISNQVAMLFFIAVSIRTARLLLLYALAKKHSAFYFHGCFYRGSKCSIAICLSQKIVHLIFIAVSIRTARLLLLYALAKKLSAFYFHGCFYKGSKCYCYML
jgi:cytochrome c-type biogenesis protein CcmE